MSHTINPNANPYVLNQLRWIAVYNDGSYLEQNDRYTGKESTTENIDREKLLRFLLVGQFGPVVSINFDRGDRFFYRRQTHVQAGPGVTGIGHIMVVQHPFPWLVGKEVETEHHYSQYGFLVVQPNGWKFPIVESFGEFRTHHPWYTPFAPKATEWQRIGMPYNAQLIPQRIVAHLTDIDPNDIKTKDYHKEGIARLARTDPTNKDPG